jgi:hypothetical protein
MAKFYELNFIMRGKCQKKRRRIDTTILNFMNMIMMQLKRETGF